ncbi:NfeD family protein [Microbacterium protaetiae]|uniref:NfeD family protein n=1 Tax=Microbacterium protaetiae TaxID=2509458 RepID=A0A4P6EGZ0_9MICO|nr:NfeD family protein [Microbacterium protaetiae]QAY61186.1 NfeD family protein [Microbacterium protaetiae]
MDIITGIEQFAWIIWIALIAIFLVIEMLSLDFTFLMLGIGGLAGLIADLFGAPLWLQLVIAALVALLLIFVLRPPLLHRLRRGEDPTPSNVAALIGMPAVVLSTVTRLGGLVKLDNGETWTARPVDDEASFAPDLHVRVARIEGATAFIRSDPETSEEGPA